DQEEVAVWQVVHAQEAGVQEVAGQQARQLRAEVDLEGVAEALAHERDARVVGRPGRALAEAGELDDVRRQLLLGIAGLLRGLRALAIAATAAAPARGRAPGIARTVYFTGE